MALVYLDTNIFIQAFESRLAIAQPARDLLAGLEMAPACAVTSELTLAELFAPVKAQGALTVAEKMALYDALFSHGFISLWPIDRAILRQTALLRQTLAQKLPDAIHVATALRADCRYLMSSDRDTKRLPASITRVLPDSAGVAVILKACRG